MASIEYFKRQAKLLLKDYNSSKEHNFDQRAVFYEEPQEHFDIKNVFLKANKTIGESLTLMKAQHLIAKISAYYLIKACATFPFGNNAADIKILVSSITLII